MTVARCAILPPAPFYSSSDWTFRSSLATPEGLSSDRRGPARGSRFICGSSATEDRTGGVPASRANGRRAMQHGASAEEKDDW